MNLTLLAIFAIMTILANFSQIRLELTYFTGKEAISNIILCCVRMIGRQVPYYGMKYSPYKQNAK